jgi:hypothetical protein
MKIYEGDNFTQKEMLEFQREYVKYYISSPLDVYDCSHEHLIGSAKRLYVDQVRSTGDTRNACVFVAGVVKEYTEAQTKPVEGRQVSTYGRLIITDGIDSALVMIWDKELTATKSRLGDDVFKPGVGLILVVRYDEARNSFSVMSEPKRKLPSSEWFIRKLSPKKC